MQYIRFGAVALALLAAIGLAACDAGRSTSGTTDRIPQTGSAATGDAPDTVPVISVPSEPVVGNDETEESGKAPVTGTVDSTGNSAHTVITLGDTVSVSGDGADVAGKAITIRRAGTYTVTGTWADGQLIIDTADASRVSVILNGASLSCSTGPAIYVKTAEKKVIIRTAKGSVNLLSDKAGYVVPDAEQNANEIYPNACFYACADLELTGEGELYITGKADKGINTKDDLTISGGTLVVTSPGVGIRANDSLTVTGGTTTVVSGGDGLKTANTEKAGKGRLTVSGGTLYITATGDALSAATDLSITDGTLVLNTLNEDGEELPESSGNNTSGYGGGMGGFGGGFGMFDEGNSDKASISAKGVKAAGELVVAGGKITVVAQDDGLHTNGNLTVSGGSLHIRSADDGMHADGELCISGGVTEIAQSYEGLEALHITISGGTNRITASDDGANATDGASSGGFGGGRPGMGGWGSSGSIEFSEDQPCLTFAGGYTVFDAAGDGIDSNGWIQMTGGTVLVYGPTDNGNGPIDFGDGGYNMTISGGTFLAVGSSGMAETAEANGQSILAAYMSGSSLPAGETIGIVDAEGKVLAAFRLPKAIASIVFSSSELQAGETYSVVRGGTFTGDATDGIIDPTTYTGYESMGQIEAY